MTNPSDEYAERIKNYRVMQFDGVAIGQYIEKELQKKGWSQSHLAEQFPSITGGKTGCVHNWVKGKNIPMPEQWAKIKSLLDLDDRFDRLLENPATAKNVQWGASPEKMVAPSAAPALAKGAITTGWQPSCDCNADTVPGLVLDPFMGSGTVALVAHRLDRDFIGFELSAEYCNIANKRIKGEVLQERLFT